MKSTLRRTCRIGLLATLLAAGSPEAGLAGNAGNSIPRIGDLLTFQISSSPLERSRREWAERIASVLTRLDGIGGVASSSALLADDGKRMVQIRIRPGANATQVAEAVRRALRAEIPDKTPALLQGKSANAVGAKPNWLTMGQLNAIAAKDESSPQLSEGGHWLLALTVFLALAAFLLWLFRRRRLANA